MNEQLPEGESIGWMQAPPQWILSHTVRFVGIVRIVIQDGEGFILIRKGKPLAYYFKHGRIELRGHGALDYFNSHPTIEFNLNRYTPDEFAQALKILKIDETGADVPPESTEPVPAKKPAPAPPAPVSQAPASQAPSPPVPSVHEPVPVVMQQAPQWPVPGRVAVPVAGPGPEEETPSVVEQVPEDVVLDAADLRLIGQIKKLNGIVAISVFSEDRNIILMGDVEIDPLLKIARNMLATARKITPRLDWGTFVHFTLQIPEGNVIVAPFHQYHLCILTTRTINIGHIRRILRDLQQAVEP
jgi:hypothetical protein